MLPHNDYTARCCDLLQRHSPLAGDSVLAWQVRLERLVEATNEVRRTQRGRSQGEYHIGLMLRGMETQLDEWEAGILKMNWAASDRRPVAAAVAGSPSVRIATLFTRVFLSGAPLLRLPSVIKTASGSGGGGVVDNAFRADADRLRAVIPALHALYDYFLALDPAVANAFITVEWGAFILAVILGFRMSFPLALCPEWDDRVAREQLRFGEYVDRLCAMGGAEYDVEEIKAGLPAAADDGKQQQQRQTPQRRSMDVLSASKIVLDMVRTKFRRRVAKLEGTAAARRPQRIQQPHHQHQHQHQHQQQEATVMPETLQHPVSVSTSGGPLPALDSSVAGCPMMDGSLAPYYPYWDETFTNNLVAGAFAAAEGAAPIEMDTGLEISDDLWTAMTMGWAQGDGGLGDV
jgi:hypothetical protein